MKTQIDILLIDDDLKDQNNFSFALNELKINYSCRFAKNIEVAAKKIKNLLPDFIFVYIPLVTDPSYFEEIRKMTIIKRIPVVLFSNEITDFIKEKTLQCGASNCFKKTSAVSELIDVLKTIF